MQYRISLPPKVISKVNIAHFFGHTLFVIPRSLWNNAQNSAVTLTCFVSKRCFFISRYSWFNFDNCLTAYTHYINQCRWIRHKRRNDTEWHLKGLSFRFMQFLVGLQATNSELNQWNSIVVQTANILIGIGWYDYFTFKRAIFFTHLPTGRHVGFWWCTCIWSAASRIITG